MVKSSNKGIKAAWKRELLKETNSIKDEAITSMHAMGMELDFEKDCILLDGIASYWMEKGLKKTGN